MKIIRLKTIMSYLMIAAMLMALLTGCVGKETTNKSGNTDKEIENQSGSEAKFTYNNQDVLEPVELIMYYIGDETEDEDLLLIEINKILKEKINATIVLKNISVSDYSTKYALTIAGGENVDMIYTSTWAFYQSEANKGAFAEVTDQVLKDYMPQHKENQAEASWGQAKIGGKVFLFR